jgi:CheY-like chemotaxis protein
MTFSRQTHPVQLITIVKEAIELLHASLPATIDVRHDLESDDYVMADPSQLHQVIMNLCTNGIQAMQQDGGVLHLALRDYEIGSEGATDFPDIPPGWYLEVVVSDSAVGMSGETLKRIYDPFFTTKEKGRGTGMGLHGIVKNCKGDIAVLSGVGQGTTFRILLPVTSQRKISEIQLPTRLATGSECILYVDDEPMQADLAEKFLKPLGYRVVAFTDSVQALQAFMDNPDQFNLVLTDMDIPKMTGRALSERIKQTRSDIPVIICSGYGNGTLDPASLDQIIDDYLIKPFSMNELAAKIRNVIDRS